MTADAPTWGEIEKFLEVDGWRMVGQRGGKRDRHIFYEKVLPGGELLSTHVSHSKKKRPSPGRFSSILRYQLRVSRREFWEALESGEPVARPADVEASPVEHPAWVMAVLTGRLHMSAKEIEALSSEEAARLVHEFHSRRRT